MTNIKSVFTAEERDEVRFQNSVAMRADSGAIEHVDEAKSHNLDKFADVCDGVYGLNLKGRLGYNMNFMAQRIFRDALRDATKTNELDDTLSDCLTAEEISEMFGFESAPLYTLDQAAHWVMITFLFTHDVAAYTESNEQGLKSRPFSWMDELIRTPLTMVASDMQYRIKAARDNQHVQMEKFGYRDTNAKSLAKFEAREKDEALLALQEKVALIKGVCDMRKYKYEFGTEEVREGMEEMIATLGLDVPQILTDIAQKYKDSLTQKADEGKRLGDVDERIIEMLPVTGNNVGTAHREAVTERVSDGTIDHITRGAAFAYEPGPAGGGIDQQAIDKALAARVKPGRRIIKKGSPELAATQH